MWGEIQLHPYVGGALGGAVGGTLPSKAPPTQGGGGFGGRRWRTPKEPVSFTSTPSRFELLETKPTKFGRIYLY